MIYQFKVQLKYIQPAVWRRLEVDSKMTFYQFHQVLQAAFEWENSHLHAFDILKMNGRKNRRVEIGSSQAEFDFFDMGDALDEEVERLSDWFKAEKDLAMYTYDFGDDWQHEIVLEKILAPEAGTGYPRCTAAAGWPPEEDNGGMLGEPVPVSLEIVAAEVNEALMPLMEDVQMDSEENDVWKHLLTKSKELNLLKPWEFLNDDEIFMVVDPVSQERLFISVLGGAGQEFGLAVYIGEEGLRSLQLVMARETPLMDVVFVQRSLLLSFVDRKELEQDDYNFLKSRGFTFRGKKQWPEFRSMVPGSYPWSIDEEEARMLVLAIEQTEHVLQLAKQGEIFPSLMENEEIFARIPRASDTGLVWESKLIPVATLYNGDKKDTAVRQLVSELDILRAAKKPVFNSEVEFDVFYIDMPVQVKEGMRPYFPLMAAAIDSRSGMALYQDIFESRDAVEAAQRGLLAFIGKFGQKPHRLLLTGKTRQSLEPVLAALAIGVSEVPELPEMENLKAFLSQMNS